MSDHDVLLEDGDQLLLEDGQPLELEHQDDVRYYWIRDAIDG